MNPNFTSDTSSSLDEMSVPLRAVSEQGTHASAGDGNAVSLLTVLIYQTIYREGQLGHLEDQEELSLCSNNVISIRPSPLKGHSPEGLSI